MEKKEKKINEALKTLFEYVGLTGDEEVEDVEVVTTTKASDTFRSNNPCGHEGQANCPMRCKQTEIGPGKIRHCHVNNCGGPRCNKVADLNC